MPVGIQKRLLYMNPMERAFIMNQPIVAKHRKKIVFFFFSSLIFLLSFHPKCFSFGGDGGGDHPGKSNN